MHPYPMNGERWQEVWQIFSRLRELSAPERANALGGIRMDTELRDRLMGLLQESTFATEQFSVSSPAESGITQEYPPETRVGRYEIVGLIGRGGFGQVYAAKDSALDRTVAIKLIGPRGSGAPHQIIEEARAASALNHPNILTIYEVIDFEGAAAMVTELVRGVSLRAVLDQAKAPLDLDLVRRYGRQAAQGLAAAHAENIVHGDVKPENILVRTDGYIKLVDFGLATNRSTGATPAGNGLAGTLRYLSPEQVLSRPTGPASDVFSLGLVLYEMTTGTHPFAGETALDTVQAIPYDSPIPPSRRRKGIPGGLETLILEMLSKEAAKRPSAGEVALALTDTPRRRAVWAWVAALCGLALGAFAGWRYLLPPPTLHLTKITPLTGNDGREQWPSISPDGRLVVYSWQPHLGGAISTLVREIGSDKSTVLPISVLGPFSWVPGGARKISYIRHAGTADSLYTIGLGGEAEQRILSARGLGQAEWSPDGHLVAYSATVAGGTQLALFVFDTATGAQRQISFPPAGAQGDQYFALSPDGKQLAFRRTLEVGDSDILVGDFPNPGALRQVTTMRSQGETLAWLRSGDALVGSAFQGAVFSLWLHPLRASIAASRLTHLGFETYQVHSATWSNRLVWLSAFDDTNIWRIPIAGGAPEQIISSSMRDADVAVSSTGMLAFRTDRSGYPEIWLSGAHGESQHRLTTLESFTGSPRWSPDGRRLAFDSRAIHANGDIYVAECQPESQACGEPARITKNLAPDVLPNWSRDGSCLYFASRRAGDWQVFRLPAGGSERNAEQVTTKGGYSAWESADGRWLYYSRIDKPETTGIWRAPLSKASPVDASSEMLFPLEYRSTATWGLIGDNIYYQTLRAIGQPTEIWAFSVQTRKRRLVLSQKFAPLARGLAVSPDNKWIYYSQTDHSSSDVVYADYAVTR